MKTEMVEFKIWGTEKYVLVTDRIDDEAAYRFKNVRLNKIATKSFTTFDDNGRHYSLHQCIWDYVPYFKQIKAEIEECGIAVPGFGKYLFLKESKQVWNKETNHFSDIKEDGLVTMLRNNKRHSLTFNQLVYMTEKNVKYEEGFAYIDCTLEGNLFVEDANMIVRMTRSIWGSIRQQRATFERKLADHDIKNTIDWFFDKMDLLDLELPEIEKIQLGIIDKYL